MALPYSASGSSLCWQRLSQTKRKKDLRGVGGSGQGDAARGQQQRSLAFLRKDHLIARALGTKAEVAVRVIIGADH